MEKLPTHVGVIMDGNGRWAQRRGLPRLLGHRAGIAALERVVRAAGEAGIRYLSVYAFSTENWRRPALEVTGLMRLFQFYAQRKVRLLRDHGVRVRFCGSRSGIPGQILEVMNWCEATTQSCRTMDLIVCFNYGGRQEILDAIAAAREAGQEITDEESLRRFLYLPDVPDPDLIVRTSGELRLSNFLLWESSYSELYFTDTLWPDFDAQEFQRALSAFEGRNRRYGMVN